MVSSQFMSEHLQESGGFHLGAQQGRPGIVVEQADELRPLGRLLAGRGTDDGRGGTAGGGRGGGRGEASPRESPEERGRHLQGVIPGLAAGHPQGPREDGRPRLVSPGVEARGQDGARPRRAGAQALRQAGGKRRRTPPGGAFAFREQGGGAGRVPQRHLDGPQAPGERPRRAEGPKRLEGQNDLPAPERGGPGAQGVHRAQGRADARHERAQAPRPDQDGINRPAGLVAQGGRSGRGSGMGAEERGYAMADPPFGRFPG